MLWQKKPLHYFEVAYSEVSGWHEPLYLCPVDTCRVEYRLNHFVKQLNDTPLKYKLISITGVYGTMSW